jgi:hypothetical protein
LFCRTYSRTTPVSSYDQGLGFVGAILRLEAGDLADQQRFRRAQVAHLDFDLVAGREQVVVGQGALEGGRAGVEQPQGEHARCRQILMDRDGDGDGGDLRPVAAVDLHPELGDRRGCLIEPFGPYLRLSPED